MSSPPNFDALLRMVSAVGGIAAAFSSGQAQGRQQARQAPQGLQGPPPGLELKDAVVLDIRSEADENDPEEP